MAQCMFTVMKQATTLTYTGFILIFISLGTGLNAQSAVTGQLSFNDVLSRKSLSPPDATGAASA